MKYLFLFLAFINSAMAEYFVPVIRWNPIVPSGSGVSAAQNQRNLGFLNYNFAEVTDLNNDDENTKNTTFSLGSYLNNEMGSLEVYAGTSNDDTENEDDSETKLLFSNFGKQIDELIIGAQVIHLNGEDSQFYYLNPSVGYKINEKIIIGGGIKRLYFNDYDFAQHEYLIGAGLIDKKYVAEILLSQKPAQKFKYKGFDVHLSKENAVTLHGTYTFDSIQLYADIESSRSESSNPDYDKNENTQDRTVGLEFKVNETLYLGASLSRTLTTYNDEEESDNSYEQTEQDTTISARYVLNENQFMVSISNGTNKTEYEDEDVTETEELESKSYALAYLRTF